MTGLCVFTGFLVIMGLLFYLLAMERHQHRWTVKGTHYTPPDKNWGKVNGPSEQVLAFERRHNEGITHVYLQCDSCGEVSEREFYGHFSPGAKLKDDELAQLRKMANLE